MYRVKVHATGEYAKKEAYDHCFDKDFSKENDPWTEETWHIPVPYYQAGLWRTVEEARQARNAMIRAGWSTAEVVRIVKKKQTFKAAV